MFFVGHELRESTTFKHPRRVLFVAKVITPLENAMTFTNGVKCQFGFGTCEVNKRRIQID